MLMMPLPQKLTARFEGENKSRTMVELKLNERDAVRYKSVDVVLEERPQEFLMPGLRHAHTLQQL